MAQTKSKSKTPYASAWQRILAFVIDGIVLLIGIAFFVTLLNIESALLGGMMHSSVLAEILLMELYGLLYFVFFHISRFQGSIGMMVMGLVLVDEASNKRMEWRQALLRYVSQLFSVTFAFVGYLMIIWTPKKQALHDMLADSLVLKK